MPGRAALLLGVWSLAQTGWKAPRHPASIRTTAPPPAVVEPLTGPQGTLTVTRIGHATALSQSGDIILEPGQPLVLVRAPAEPTTP